MSQQAGLNALACSSNVRGEPSSLLLCKHEIARWKALAIFRGNPGYLPAYLDHRSQYLIARDARRFSGHSQGELMASSLQNNETMERESVFAHIESENAQKITSFRGWSFMLGPSGLNRSHCEFSVLTGFYLFLIFIEVNAFYITHMLSIFLQRLGFSLTIRRQ